MEKSPAASPLFRFNEDRIHAIIKETMQKKPVNRDYNLNPQQVLAQKSLKHAGSNSNLTSMTKFDPRDYLASIGFAKGRLKEKNWIIEDLNHKQRIQAPGPTRFHQVEELESASDELDDVEVKSRRIKNKFKKLPLQSIAKSQRKTTSPQRASTSRTYSRQTTSQLKAKEYLCYLTGLSNNEKIVLNEQILIKKEEIEADIKVQAYKSQSKLNFKGIFSNEINKLRVESMVPVRVQARVKTTVQPLAKSAKNLALDEKAKVLMRSGCDLSSEIKATSRSIPKEKTLDDIKSLIVKEEFGLKTMDDSGKKRLKGGVKVGWIERINRTVADIVRKTKPDERMMKVLAL